MITTVDILIGVIVPVVLGTMAAALLFRFWPRVSSLAAASGMLIATLAGFFCRFGSDNYAFADGQTISTFWLDVAHATWSDLAAPKVAIAWVPCFAIVAFLVAAVVARLDRQTEKRTSLLWIAGAGSFFVATCGIMTRVLWTSVYFTQQYGAVQRLLMVAVPGFALTAIWMAAWWRDKRMGDERVNDKMTGDDRTLDTPTAFGHSGGLFVLALTAVVLVSTSGSLTFALLLMPTLSFGVIFAALAWKKPWGKSRLHHRQSLQAVASVAVASLSLPVVIGHFMAEVAWWAAALHTFRRC